MRDRGLLFTAYPFPDESFVGYLLRLTELNRYKTLSWILQLAKITGYFSQFSFARNLLPNLSLLSHLTGIDEAALASLMYPPVRVSEERMMGDYSVFGSPMPYHIIRSRNPKVCPKCLNDYGYTRKIWELGIVTVCPIHKVRLIDMCPNCLKKISWSRGRISVCRCGVDWRDHTAPQVADLEIAVTRHVYWLCNLHYSDDSSACPLPSDSPLKELRLRDFASALIFVASQYAAIIDTKGKHLFSKRTNDEIHELLNKALLAFIDWPRGFFSFIDFRYSQKLSGNPTRGKEEPQAQTQLKRQLAPITWKDFENTKPALFIQLAASQFDFIRSAYKEYMAMRWRERVIANAELNSCKSAQLISSRDSTVAVEVMALPPSNADYMSGNAAMRALEINLSPTALKRLIIAGKLNAIVSRHRGRSVYLIESSSVENLKTELVNSLSLCDVMRLLGLTSKRIKELVENKVLKPLRGPEIDGNSDWRFSAKEAEGILRVLNSKVRQLRRAGNDRAITFNHVLRKLGKVGIKLSTFIQAILNDQVSACGKTGQQGLHGLLFSEREIVSLVWTELRRRIGDVLSISDFAEELDIGQEAAAFLVKKGIVQAEIKDNLKSFGPLIARSAVEAFNSTYLLPRKLVPELKTSSKVLTRLLISSEIKPASGRKIDGGHIYIFERHAIQSVNLKWLLDGAKQRKAAQIASANKLNEKEAANFLGITHRDLLDLVRRGILKQDKRLQRYRANKNEYIFTLQILKEYKPRIADFKGLVSSKVAAVMLGICQSWFLTKYVYSQQLKAVRRGTGQSAYYFREQDVLSLKKMTPEEIEKTYSSAEAAKLCGVNITCIYKWTVSGLLKPVSGPNVDGAVDNRYLREDVERLHAKREAYKADKIKKGGVGRYGWTRGQRPRPVQDMIGWRIEQIINEAQQGTSEQHISGSKIYKQLVAEGFELCRTTVYDYINNARGL